MEGWRGGEKKRRTRGEGMILHMTIEKERDTKKVDQYLLNDLLYM